MPFRVLRLLLTGVQMAIAIGCTATQQSSLEPAPGEAHRAELRTLARDRDIDVAENALRTLNAALRLDLPPLVSDTVWDVRLARAGVHILHVLDDHTVVLGIGYGSVDESRVVGFDLAAHKVSWTYATGDGVRSNAVRVGDRLYFVSDDRVIHCLSVDGTPRWAKPLTSTPELGTTGPAITAVGDRLFVPDGQSIYVVSLAGEVQAHALGDHVSRDLVHGRRKVFGAIHNGPLLVLDEAAFKRVPTGLKTAALSAAGDVVCIVSFGPAYQLQCLSQETLRELWRVDLPNEIGAYKKLEHDADNVYVLAQGRALAFNIADGKRLWATNEFTSGAFFKSAGRAALTRNENFELEWRDPSSGEVIARWGTRERGFVGGAAFLRETVLVETRGSDQGDGLRLLRLPNTIAERLTGR
jgi:outer membrane protein assembly factor BamB